MNQSSAALFHLVSFQTKKSCPTHDTDDCTSPTEHKPYESFISTMQNFPLFRWRAEHRWGVTSSAGRSWVSFFACVEFACCHLRWGLWLLPLSKDMQVRKTELWCKLMDSNNLIDHHATSSVDLTCMFLNCEKKLCPGSQAWTWTQDLLVVRLQCKPLHLHVALRTFFLSKKQQQQKLNILTFSFPAKMRNTDCFFFFFFCLNVQSHVEPF